MDNLAEKKEYAQPVLEYGIVAAAREEGFLVLVDTACREASLAVSCIVRPEKGDVVLLSMDSGKVFILSILERPGEQQARTLQFDGQVDMQVKNGGFRLTADDSLYFSARETMAMASRQIEIDALEGNARIEKMSYAGRIFHSQVEKMKMIADAVDSIFRRVVQRVTSSYRYVEEHEEIQSASTRMLVDGTLTMQTKNTMHVAEGHIKIDAEQIHLG